MNKFSLLLNTILLYCAASFLPNAFSNIKKYSYLHHNDEFKLITYSEYLENKQNEIIKNIKITKDVENNNDIESRLDEINKKKQELNIKEDGIKHERQKLNNQTESIIQVLLNKIKK